jgi:hypothetical protein
VTGSDRKTQITTSRLRVRPRPLGWFIVAGLFLFSIPLIGLGILWLTSGDVAIGVICFGPGILLAVFPAAYFAVARVELSDDLLTKVVLFWKADRCPAPSLRSIVWFKKSRYSYGYKFEDTYGRIVFTVSPFFWSYTDVARLGQALGVVITGGRAAYEQRRLALNRGADSVSQPLHDL